MANDKRRFYCLPRRAMMDPDLSGLDHRVLGAIAIHDGMSAHNGKGAGCVASNKTLSAMVGCDYTNLSKAVGRLIRKGYVTREPQLLDKRKFTLRVAYDVADPVPMPGSEGWRDDQQSEPKGAEIVGDAANFEAEIVGHGEVLSDGNTDEIQKHYIPLRGVIDFVETKGIDSAKLRVADATRLAKQQVLHRDGEPLHETLAKFERQWKSDWTLYRGKLAEWASWLDQQADFAFDNDEMILCHRARRMSETVAYMGWEIGEIAEEAA